MEKLTVQITQQNRLSSYKQLMTEITQSVKITLILKPIKTKYKTWIFIVKTAENTLNVHIQKYYFSIRQKSKRKIKMR